MTPFNLMQIATIGLMAAGFSLMMIWDNRVAAFAVLFSVMGTHTLLLIGYLVTKYLENGSL